MQVAKLTKSRQNPKKGLGTSGGGIPRKALYPAGAAAPRGENGCGRARLLKSPGCVRM